MALNNYPFNRRIIASDTLGQEKHEEDKFTITGQLLTEGWIIPSLSQCCDPQFDENACEALNPQQLEPDFLLRNELKNLSSFFFRYLKKDGKRSLNEILNAALILREAIWNYWDERLDELGPEDDDDSSNSNPSDYFTGAQAEHVGPKSYWAWLLFSSPDDALQNMSDDKLDKIKWMEDGYWSGPEIYVLLSLWEIDESAVYLNKGNPYKATAWLVRAMDNKSGVYLHKGCGSPFDDAKKKFARLGGHGKKEKYRPLKEFMIEKVNSRNYPSRRNAALSLKAEILMKAKELGIGLSEQQAGITIASWLKECGLPANK